MPVVDRFWLGVSPVFRLSLPVAGIFLREINEPVGIEGLPQGLPDPDRFFRIDTDRHERIRRRSQGPDDIPFACVPEDCFSHPVDEKGHGHCNGR